LLVEEGERAALYFQRKDFEIVRKIKFAPKPNKPRRLDTLSNVLGDVRVGSIATELGRPRHVRFTPVLRTSPEARLVPTTEVTDPKSITCVYRKPYPGLSNDRIG